MTMRHYNLDYSTDGGTTWIDNAITDETPGPGKTLTISGLANPGDYSVKLRLIATTGDTTPVVSDAVALQLGNPVYSEPVQAVATAVVTLADVITMRDNLLAAAGVTVSEADLQAMNEALTVSATAAATVADNQNASGQENVQTLATALATLTDAQIMLEQTLAAASAMTTATDANAASDAVTAPATSAASVADGVAMTDTVSAASTSVAAAAATQAMLEQVSAAANAVATAADAVARADTLTAAATSVATVADIRAMLEQVSAAATSAATVADSYTPGATVPGTVTGVSASNSPAQITVSWTAVSGATSYKVYYNTANSSSGATLAASGITGTSYSINGPLAAGTTYYCFVKGTNAVGDSAAFSVAAAAAATKIVASDDFSAGTAKWLQIGTVSFITVSDGMVGGLWGAALYNSSDMANSYAQLDSFDLSTFGTSIYVQLFLRYSNLGNSVNGYDVLFSKSDYDNTLSLSIRKLVAGILTTLVTVGVPAGCDIGNPGDYTSQESCEGDGGVWTPWNSITGLRFNISGVVLSLDTYSSGTWTNGVLTVTDTSSPIASGKIGMGLNGLTADNFLGGEL